MKRLTLAVAALALASAALTGCVERRITILSNPEGALVTLNDVEIGRTPITVPFTWYGDYDIVLRYEREIQTPDGPKRQVFYKHTHEKAEAPPHQWLGVDLVTELMPSKFEDHKTWAFVLEPLPELSDQEVLANAEELKAQLDRPAALVRDKKTGKIIVNPAATRPTTAPATGPGTSTAPATAASSQPAAPTTAATAPSATRK